MFHVYTTYEEYEADSKTEINKNVVIYNVLFFCMNPKKTDVIQKKSTYKTF